MAGPIDPIPPQYASATPYLTVSDGVEALAFYARAFGAIEIYRLTASDGTVLHAEFRIGAALLMLGVADSQAGAHPPVHSGSAPIATVVFVEDVDSFAERAIGCGCTAQRTVADQFYGDRTTALTDPFGFRWTFATHIEDVSPVEMQARIDHMFAAGG